MLKFCRLSVACSNSCKNHNGSGRKRIFPMAGGVYWYKGRRRGGKEGRMRGGRKNLTVSLRKSVILSLIPTQDSKSNDVDSG